jgi:nucleotide-binding universal stress UspA family protein
MTRPAVSPSTNPTATANETDDAGRVVVAVDGGWDTRRALTTAATEAECRDVGLVVVTVSVPRPVEPGGYEAWSVADQDAVDHARAVNEEALTYIRDTRPDLPIQGVVAASTRDLADLLGNAGLLVLGRRGASGRGVFRMGSTSGDLLRLYHGPIVVCRDDRDRQAPPNPSLRRPEVVVGIHLAEEIPTVLRRAVQEARLRAMPLCVFSSGRGATGIVTQERIAAEVAGHSRLVWTSLEEAAEAILRYADPDDLIVLGARGRERLAGHVPGSVTRAVLDAMPCDVMLVPL